MTDVLTTVETYADFVEQIAECTAFEKGLYFERLCFHILKILPQYTARYEEAWLYDDVPHSVKKQLNLPERDRGIDIIVKSLTGDFIAVQCKYRSKVDTKIPWSDVSTFYGLSFGINSKINSGILITNTDKLCQEAIKSEKVQCIFGSFFDEIPDFFWNFMHSMIKDDKPAEYVCKIPFKHQTDCVDALIEHFEDKNNLRSNVILACGTGKAVLSYWIDKSLQNKVSVLFVPSLYLLSQTYMEWAQQSHAEKVKINYVLVGSDADVNQNTIEKSSNGLQITTDKEQLTHMLTQSVKLDYKTVVFCTYQSSQVLASTATSLKLMFDMAIADEAHMTVGSKLSAFACMLNEDNFACKKRVFMTATSRCFEGKGDDDSYASMDDEQLYGKQSYVYNTRTAINDGVLTDFVICGMFCKDEDVTNHIKNNDLVKFQNDTEEYCARYLATAIVILSKFADSTCTHLITYHSTIKKAEYFCGLLQKISKHLALDVNVDTIDGRHSMKNRRKIIKEFTNKPLSILCSANVLTTGINIQCADSLCFVDEKSSSHVIKQCVGRLLRKSDGKNQATILIPVFHEQESGQDCNSDQLVKIIRNLNEDDQSLTFHTKSNTTTNKQMKIDLIRVFQPDTTDKLFEIDLDKWIERIRTDIIQKIDPWNSKMEQVKLWKLQHNNEYPSNTSQNEFENNLGQWVKRNRNLNKNIQSNLDQQRVDIINKVFEDWVWFQTSTRVRKTLQQYIDELKKWRKQNNNKYPSAKSKDQIEKDLGQWVCHSKRLKHTTKISKTVQEKINLINKEFTDWIWANNEAKVYKTFQQTVDELKLWRTNNSNKYPSARSTNSDTIEKSLGTWVDNQRQLKNKAVISQETQKKIDIITKEFTDWIWFEKTVQIHNTFQQNVDQLKVWLEQNNNKYPSSKSTDAIEKFLGQWVQNTKRMKHQGIAANCDNENQNKIDMISRIFTDWVWPQKSTQVQKPFQQTVDQLKLWRQENDNQYPSARSNNESDKALGRWIEAHRGLKNKNITSQLDQQKIDIITKEFPDWLWYKQRDRVEKTIKQNVDDMDSLVLAEQLQISIRNN